MTLRIPIYSSWPLVISNATPTSDGAMSAADKAKLDSVAAPGVFVALTLLNGFGTFPSLLGPARARLSGDTVQFEGAAEVPNAGTPGATLIAILPVNQRPSAVRFLAAGVFDLGVSAVLNLIIIDDAAGSETGTPGAVVLNYAVGAAVGKALSFDGLSFVL